MKSLLRSLTLGLLLFVPALPALAQAPIVSAISDVTLNAGASQSVSVVAVGAPDSVITLTASLPAFCTLHTPTSGTGIVTTTISLAPTAGDVGTHTASVTAASGSLSSTKSFQIVVNAAGSNQGPVVVAPALKHATVGAVLSFTVTASDADGDAITALAATGLPSGATFTPNGTNTSGSFSWTPVSGQQGDYDVVFTATNALSGSATTHIRVENRAPKLSAPGSRSVTEGQTLAFTVTATDADGDHVTLTTGTLPSGASATDQGNNTLQFSWQPSTGQAGVYTVTFLGDDGHGGTASKTTTITVLAAGSGGGTATATLIGEFRTRHDRTCFRIRPVNGSFDVRNVNLSTITLGFGGKTLAALAGSAHLQFDCERDSEDVERGDDAARLLRDGWHPGETGDGDDNDECDECDNDCTTCNSDSCAAVGIRVCFATQDLITLFGDAVLPASLATATIQFTLTDGTVIVATISDAHLTDNDHGKKGLNPHARPNPCNPRTVLSFTLSRPGRVQVAVYDMQGRLVNKLLDEVRQVGQQDVVWDGSNSRSAHVASGVYYFRIQAPEGRVIQRIAVVK